MTTIWLLIVSSSIACAVVRGVVPLHRRARVRHRLNRVSPFRTSPDVASPSANRWGRLGERCLAPVGAYVRRRAGRPPDAMADRWIGAAVIVAVVGGVTAGLVAGVVLAAMVWSVPVVWRRRRFRRQHESAIAEAPELIDLVCVALSAGLTTRLALPLVAGHGDGVIASGMRAVTARLARGDRLVDALDELAAVGEPGRPLYEALTTAERHGTPVLPGLERACADARLLRRRRREEAARRLPVQLLFPLVLCTLPALALLTVVPLVARFAPSLSSLNP